MRNFIENFDLKAFVEDNFYYPVAEKTFDNNKEVSLPQYIKQMWNFLHQSSSLSSFIPLTKPYIIPGGKRSLLLGLLLHL